ncbi:MAG: biotin/lipoyl-binding protein, partial [Leeuwenhoekiella sp.]
MRDHFPVSLIVHRGIYIPREPSWLFRWGNLLLFTLLLFSIVIASLTASDETTSAPVTISTLSPAVDLHSYRSGIIEQIYVAQGDTVKQDQLLAVLKSKTDFGDITYLKNRISSEDFTDLLQVNATLRLDGEVATAYV